MRCRYICNKDTGFEKVWIPGCWGGIYGKDGCTCYKIKNQNISKKQSDNEQLQEECSWLKAKLESMEKQNHKLKREMLELQRMGLPIAQKRLMEKDPAYLVTILRKYYQAK